MIRQFVVRKCELEIVLEILRGNIDSPSCEHVLLVAPRGRGKTTLLARVASELRTDTELSGRLFPIRFMEESQEIFNLADFWLETLFYLARESTERDPDLSRELEGHTPAWPVNGVGRISKSVHAPLSWRPRTGSG